MKDRFNQLRMMLLGLQERTRMPGSAASHLRGTIASVNVRRNGSIAVTVYLLPIDRPALKDFQPGTCITLSK